MTKNLYVCYWLQAIRKTLYQKPKTRQDLKNVKVNNKFLKLALLFGKVVSWNTWLNSPEKTQARNTRNLKYWFKNNRVTIFALGVAILLIFFLGLSPKRFSTKSRAESLEIFNNIGGQDRICQIGVSLSSFSVVYQWVCSSLRR